MSASEPLHTHQKALTINLDPRIFGSFAEIGAGQEVARWFLQVGAASGTVAKTISAYDKEVSDDLYGAGTRYVSKPRLQAMLEHEWSQLLSQLDASRGKSTCFFSFVDTVSARNFAGDNETHGWVGLRFQTQPQGPPSDVILHVNLRDTSNLAQQAAVGILGVNLIFAACYHLQSIDEFLAQLAADLPLDRMEFDSVECSGPAFAQWNPRVVHASLVANQLAEAIAFPLDGTLAPPTDLLYKKAVALALGPFNLEEISRRRIIENVLATLPKQEVEQSKGSVGFFCFSRAPQAADEPPLTAGQILERVDGLQQAGGGVLVSRERELYKVGAFVNRYTKSRVHFVAGLSVLVRVLLDTYKDLDGSLLEGISRLFRENVRVSVFPMPAADLQEDRSAALASGWKWPETNAFVGALDIEPPEPLSHLYRYLIACDFIQPRELPARESSARAK